MAIPSSSVSPEVICSGWPSGKRWRQVWKTPPALELKYIHSPWGDHPANVHDAPGGPTRFPWELSSNGTKRQGTKAPLSFISTSNIDFRSGEG